MSILTIHTDGGARGNPGPAAVGVVLRSGEVVCEHGRCIGNATNNFAEYTAVLDALEKIPAFLSENPQVSQLEFLLDSQLIVCQINGQYKIKEPTLLTLYTKVKQRLAEIALPYTFQHIPRQNNKEADRLVNQALDQA